MQSIRDSITSLLDWIFHSFNMLICYWKECIWGEREGSFHTFSFFFSITSSSLSSAITQEFFFKTTSAIFIFLYKCIFFFHFLISFFILTRNEIQINISIEIVSSASSRWDSSRFLCFCNIHRKHRYELNSLLTWIKITSLNHISFILFLLYIITCRTFSKLEAYFTVPFSSI